MLILLVSSDAQLVLRHERRDDVQQPVRAHALALHALELVHVARHLRALVQVRDAQLVK